MSVSRALLRASILGLALGGAVLGAQSPAFYFETGAGRKAGDFGTPTRSTLLYGYETVGLAASTFDLNLTLPALQLKRSGGGIEDQASGPGDVLLGGTLRLAGNPVQGLWLDGGTTVKWPTASASRGLGTGQADIGGFLNLHWRRSLFEGSGQAGWIATGRASSSYQAGTASMAGPGSMMGGGAPAPATSSPGQAPGLTSGLYLLGASVSALLPGTRITGTFQARGPQYTWQPGAREVGLGVYRTLGPKWALRASAFAGLTNGGPRNGVDLAVVYWP